MTDIFALPKTTTERLLMVADLIELHPERWDQESYVMDGNCSINDPEDVAGSGLPKCGTTLCVAGWGVALTPAAELAHLDDWDEAGSKALGFDEALGEYLFYRIGDPNDGSAQAIRKVMPGVLRDLAAIPEGERTRWDEDVENALLPFQEIVY